MQRICLARCATVIAVLISLFISAVAVAQEVSKEKEQETYRIIRIPQVFGGTDPLYNYVKTLLQMALDSNADQYGKVKLLPNERGTVQERQLRNLDNRLLDVTWSVTTAERENLHKAVRIPLTAGLFGQRLLLIREGDLRFNSVISLNTLKQYRAVQGQDWPDTRLYRYHGFSVLESTYQASFKVLAEGFADYYPRGILEVDYELEYAKDLPIALEKHLLIRYPSAMFFFVSRDNHALAYRIEQGLISLLESGEFQSLLESQPFYQSSAARAKGRHVLELTNPMLSNESHQAMEDYLPYFNITN
ncbi:amino acid ABC transporter substrate-binding protein [Alteromonas sp. H39]|uniref:amino acid ABC transporter substrate-binding protein n=1 Tax=Alteromonas sp. H39 TaxID=3389876 RepID=UPI0039DFDC05